MNPVVSRLTEERNKWRRDHPEGFDARPAENTDGTLDLFTWICEVPGPRKSPQEGGQYKLRIRFNSSSLSRPPRIFFDPVIFHPNVSTTDGYVCSSLINLWPEVGIKQLLFAIQSFLETPNPLSPLNSYAADLYVKNRKKYDDCVRKDFEIL